METHASTTSLFPSTDVEPPDQHWQSVQRALIESQWATHYTSRATTVIAMFDPDYSQDPTAAVRRVQVALPPPVKHHARRHSASLRQVNQHHPLLKEIREEAIFQIETFLRAGKRRNSPQPCAHLPREKSLNNGNRRPAAGLARTQLIWVQASDLEPLTFQSPDGEIGRRSGLKIRRPQGRGGSSPPLGTMIVNHL